MTRTYTLKKRAEQQAETRQRIVDAAVELHSTVGPLATTLSMIAEKAGVQRHTLYAHFPDERSIFQACSAEAHQRDPSPTADAWRDIADRTERLTAALTDVYGWYERNAQLLGNVMRDVERHPEVQELQKRVAPVRKGWHDVLGEKLDAKQRTMLHIALSFFTWRTLTQQAGVKQAAAVTLMVEAVLKASA
jgi:AcrR family transcriptional regulator